MPHNTITRPVPPVEYLRECLDYRPETGALVWLGRPPGHFSSPASHFRFMSRWAGKPAGSYTASGYLSIRLGGTLYMAHRLAWALYYGAAPEVSLALDHINGRKDDNRIANLREVTHAVNGLGAVKNSKNTSGHNGVSWASKQRKWCAQVGFQGKVRNLGYYDDIADAIAARKRADAELGFSAYHGQDNPCNVPSTSPQKTRCSNTSGHPGVWYRKSRNRWEATIMVAGKSIYLGRFKVKEDAIAARKAGEIEYGVADRIVYGSGAIIQDPPT